MSWQATAWAIRQNTGSARRKLVLLGLAYYADKNGVCWPSQETLARDTEQSVDTVQRQLDALEHAKLIQRERKIKRRGQWQGYLYKLPLNLDQVLRGQNASLSPDQRRGQAANRGPGQTAKLAA